MTARRPSEPAAPAGPGTGAPSARSASVPACPPLDTLAGLAGHGHYAQALDLLGQSEDLRAELMPDEAQALEALLRVCESCDAEARTHHAALAQAVEREHALGQQLQALTAHLLHADGEPTVDDDADGAVRPRGSRD